MKIFRFYKILTICLFYLIGPMPKKNKKYGSKFNRWFNRFSCEAISAKT